MNDVQENTPKLRALDPSEERFCELFAATRQGAYAFREVYDQAASHTTVAHHAAGQKLLADDAIKSFISELTAKLAMANYTTLQSCFEMWVNIASADPDELIGLRIGACRHCHGEGFKRQWKYTEYLEACDAAEAAHEALTEMQKAKFPLRMPDVAGGADYDHTRDPNPHCPNCRGEGIERVVARDTSRLSPSARLLYGGVKVTKNGIEVIMADRDKARENVTRMLGGFQDNLNLKANMPLMQMVNAVQINANDPKAAADAYEKMIKGIKT